MLSNIFNIFGTIFSQRDFDANKTAPQRPPTTKDASYLTPADRRDIVARMLKGVANVQVVSAIQNRITAQAVGRGIIPSYTGSGDVEFEIKCNQVIKDWSESADAFDIGGRLTLADYQILTAIAQLTTGELFTVHRLGGLYGYQVQAINSEAVTGDLKQFESISINGLPLFPKLFDEQGIPLESNITSCYDGIALDANGKALAYRLSNGTVLMSNDVTHTYDATREANAYRGLPFAWTSVNAAIDLHELTADAVGSAKAQGRFAWFRKGRKPRPFSTKRQNGIGTDSGALPPSSDEGAVIATDMTRVLGGRGAMWDLAEGEEITPATASAPSDRTMTMLVILSERICLSYGFSSALILTGSASGTATRAELSNAEKTIYRIQRLICRLTKILVIRLLASAQEKNMLGGKLPPGFERYISLKLPSTITVDYGRDTKANLEMLRAGQITEKDLQEAEGRTWQEVQDQRIAEVKRWIDLCGEAGIPYAQVVVPPAGSAPAKEGKETP